MRKTIFILLLFVSTGLIAQYQPYTQSFRKLSDLALQIGRPYSSYFVSGGTAEGDGGGGMFYWHPTSTATPVAGSIVQVTGVTTGRWIRTLAEQADTSFIRNQNAMMQTATFKINQRGIMGSLLVNSSNEATSASDGIGLGSVTNTGFYVITNGSKIATQVSGNTGMVLTSGRLVKIGQNITNSPEGTLEVETSGSTKGVVIKGGLTQAADFFQVKTQTVTLDRIDTLGRIGIKVAPSAYVTLPPGTATAGTAPLKFSRGHLLFAAEDGAMNYDSIANHLYFTIGSTRYQLDQQSSGGVSTGNPDSLHGQPWSYYLDRTNHTNSQTLSTISDFPSQTSNSGKFLTTDGSVTSWATVVGGGGSGSVTSVAKGIGLVADGTITTTGTINVDTVNSISTKAYRQKLADSLGALINTKDNVVSGIVASGTDTYTATFSPTPTAYTYGMKVLVQFTNANTAPATLNLNSLGAKAIVKGVALPLVGGDLGANSTQLLMYDGTNFVIVGSTILSNNYTSWTPTLTGFSSAPTVTVSRYALLDKMCTVEFNCNTTASNATTFTITLPFAAKSQCVSYAGVTNAGANVQGAVRTRAGSNILDVFVTYVAPFSASSVKKAEFKMTYEIDN